jgi:epoxyqueuosine reductase
MPPQAAVGSATLTHEVRARLLAAGFARVGVARAEPLVEEAVHLRRWLERGHHGTMAWMERNVDVRVDPGHADMLPGARSVVVVASPYAAGGRAVASGAPGTNARIARYAQGPDYHERLYARMRPVKRFLRARGFGARASVDSMPVLERAWAQRAGVGFIGKNCCLIVPGIGSHVFLACLITTAVLDPDRPMRERCGSCRLCLDACPTRAFTAPRSLDARRCVAYLTIEHRGAIDEALRPGLGDRVFGCDACQDVCPFNRGEGAEAGAGVSGVENVALGDERLAQARAAELLALDDGAFRTYARGTPLKRTRRDKVARNAAIALGNAGDRRSLPVLRDASERDPSPVVREAAAWALARIRGA